MRLMISVDWLNAVTHATRRSGMMFGIFMFFVWVALQMVSFCHNLPFLCIFVMCYLVFRKKGCKVNTSQCVLNSHWRTLLQETTMEKTFTSIGLLAVTGIIAILDVMRWDSCEIIPKC